MFSNERRSRRGSVSPYCRITGKSHSMEEHHYTPSPEDFPRLEMKERCRITEKNSYFKDYHFVYPVIEQDGTSRMVTEHDFHCRITGKYRAMAGHKYIFPVLGASNNKTTKEMESIISNESYGEILIPAEVEKIVRGGIKDVMKLNNSEYLFIYSKEGSLFPAALREIPPKKIKEFGKYSRRHTVPVDIEAQLALTLGSEVPLQVKKVKDLVTPPADFSVITDKVQLLKDIRKSRPRKPRRKKGRLSGMDKENESDENMPKRAKIEDESVFVVNGRIEEESIPMENGRVEEDEILVVNGEAEDETIDECEIISKPIAKPSRLEKYKLQFQNIDVFDSKKSKNMLVSVGTYDPNDVVELDFSENSNETNDQMMNGDYISVPCRTDSEVSNEQEISSNSSLKMTNDINDLYSVESGTDLNEVIYSTLSSKEVTTKRNSNNMKGENYIPVNGTFDDTNISDTVSDVPSSSNDRASSLSLKSDSSVVCMMSTNDLQEHGTDFTNLQDLQFVNGKTGNNYESNSCFEEIFPTKSEICELNDILAAPKKMSYSNPLLPFEIMNGGNTENDVVMSSDASSITNSSTNGFHENVNGYTHTPVMSLNSSEHYKQNHTPDTISQSNVQNSERRYNETESKEFQEKTSLQNSAVTSLVLDQISHQQNGKSRKEIQQNYEKRTEIMNDEIVLGKTVSENVEIKLTTEEKNKMLQKEIPSRRTSSLKKLKKWQSVEFDPEGVSMDGPEMAPITSETDAFSRSNNSFHSNGTVVTQSFDDLTHSGSNDVVQDYTCEKFQNNDNFNIPDAQTFNIPENEEKITFECNKQDSLILLKGKTSDANKIEVSEADPERELSKISAPVKNVSNMRTNLTSSRTDDEITKSSSLNGQISPNSNFGNIQSTKVDEATLLNCVQTKISRADPTYSNERQMIISADNFAELKNSPKEQADSDICENLNGSRMKRSPNSNIGSVQSMKVDEATLLNSVQTKISRADPTYSNEQNMIISPDNFTELKNSPQRQADNGICENLNGSRMKMSPNSNIGNVQPTKVDEATLLNCVQTKISRANPTYSNEQNMIISRDNFTELKNSPKGQADKAICENLNGSQMKMSPNSNIGNVQSTKVDEVTLLNCVQTTISRADPTYSNERNMIISPDNFTELKNSPQGQTDSGICENLNGSRMKVTDREDSVRPLEESLRNMNSRLPVTCSLMLKGFSLPVEVSTGSRCQGLDESSGYSTTMQCRVDSTDNGAKWNDNLQAVDVYMAIMNFQPMESDEESVPMKEGQQVEVIDATKPRRWLVRTCPIEADDIPREGWVPACYLEKSTAEQTISNFAAAEIIRDAKEAEAIENREAIVRELVETEEDFSKDMQFVVENYYKRLDDPQVPKELRDRKGSIFGNFKDISDFHNNVLMKGVYYHANEPTKLGKIFLRLERDFDMHANYCWNEARAQRILKDDKFKGFFEGYSQTISDDKTITDHLKLPIQRLNDYQLLLKEIIKYSSRLNEDTNDLQKALEFIHSINKRTKDLQYIQSIQGCQGDLLKIGRIIRHDIFDVLEDTTPVTCERHVFLFKGRVILTDKIISEAGDELFQATNAFKLQDVKMIENLSEDPQKILFRHSKKHRSGFPFHLCSKSIEQKETWLKEANAHIQVTEDLGDEEPIVIRDVPIPAVKDKSKESEASIVEAQDLKHKVEELEVKNPSEPDQKKTKVGDKDSSTNKEEDVPKPKERKSSLKRQPSLKKTETDAVPSPSETKEEKNLQRKQSLKRQDSQGKRKKSASEKETDATEIKAELPPKSSAVKRQASLDKTQKDSKDGSTKGQTDSKPTETSLKRQQSEDKTKKSEVPLKRQQSEENTKKESKDLPQNSDTKTEESSPKKKPPIESQQSVKKGKEEPKVKDVTMSEKPSFVKALRGVTCGLGEKAALECETAGNPTPSVTWLKDNQRISKGKKIQTTSIGQKHALTIKETSPEDGGLYTVVANNAQGSASCSALLNLKLALLGLPKEDSRPATPGGTILPHAPVFKVKLNKETQLLDGTCVRFELVVRGSPEPTVKFLKDGKELKQDERVRVAYENKEIFELILDHVSAKDAGTYSCVATNSLGSDTTTGNLCVVKNKDVFKGIGEYVEEDRTPTPRPRTPKFKWFKDGQDFEASERFQVIFNEEEDSLALMFQHVTPEDAGLYTCVASTSTGSKIACSAELTVQGVVREVEAPGIKAELADVEATEGGSAMLELKITGYPKPKVTWFHKKKEVATGGRYRFLFADEETFTLVIKNVKKDDSGQYSVKAVNEIGEAESSCQLSVKSAPSFSKGLKDKSVMAEEVLAFEIEIDGNPAPDVKWYKDGQQLNPSDRITITDAGNKKYCLKIAKAKQADSGSYSCVLTNALGSQAEFSNVVVKASPTFVKEMENVEGLEGSSLHFSVEVNGNPKPSLKWTKDGKELKVDGKHVKVIEDGINAYSLAVENATAADVGVYTCELRNDHGMKSSSGNLAIKTKPEFIKKLSDVEVNEGDPLSFSTTVKGYPLATVKWLLNEKNLAENKNYTISSDLKSLGANLGSYTLKLKKVNRTMAGKYTCEATNEMGTATSVGTLNVKVVNQKPEFDESLKPTQLVEGKPGKLVAKISGQPRPKVQWLKDGSPITPGGRFRVQEEPDGSISLLIDEVSSNDAGLYSIVATSDEGEAKCDAAVTTIPPGRKPEFVKELEEAVVMESKPLSLVAKVTGKPTSVKWQKDGKDISPSDRVTINEGADGTVSLKIPNATLGDAGKYAVVATNAEGKARSVALVEVKACSKPSIDSSLKPLTLADGETGKLKLKVSGEPKPALTWLKDGKPLKMSNRVDVSEEPDGTIALTINNARPEDAGKYTVVAANSMGEVESAAPVEVNQAPTFQKQLEPVDVVEGYPAKLEAKLSGSPPPEIKWKKDGKEITPDGEHIKEVRSPDGTVALLIDNCKPEDAAKYSLTAKNSLGEKESNGSLAVSSKTIAGEPEKVPSFLGPLNDVSVKEGETIRFEAKVSGNPLPDISWTLNGESIKPSDSKLFTFGGNKAVLDIKNCSPEDAGTYQCILSNPLGKASSEGKASVQGKAAPRFAQQLTDFTGFIGNPVTLNCRVKAYPEPDIDWFFNGNRLTPNEKYSITKAGDFLTLSIKNCQPEDSGIFECRAGNSVGEDRTRSAVNISDKIEKGEPPTFLKKIGDCEVMEGMTAKFTACVTGIPTPDVKWSKDGQPLEISSRHKTDLESTGILRMVIRNVDPSDYGEYSVAISNLHGSATSSAHIRPDSLDQKFISPIGDQFVGFDKFKKTGAPVPLPDKPRIVRMSDDALTLAWKPSVPSSPREPVTYQIEMSKHPGGEYEPFILGLKDTLCDLRGLTPGQDYKFRIRVENKFGVSEPSPYTTAHRSKLREAIVPADFVPEDFEIEHPPLEKYAAPPRFVRKEEDAMYGVRGNPVTIEFWLYGHPEPEVTWYKDDVQIGKDKYGFLQDRNGKLSVFIDMMTNDHVGTYSCHAVNSEGEARMKIKLLIAEHPVFTQKLDETTAMVRRCARMQCKVTGVPYPKIKWFRDWHPLYESDRVKILWEEPDICTLFLTGLITRDAGLFSCSAGNVAGTATSSAVLNVEDSEDMFDRRNYNFPLMVKPRSKKFEDYYDVGEELGRGTQSIVRHVVKRESGESYAAKMMNGKGKFKDFMRSEMAIMSDIGHPKLVRLYDVLETDTSLDLVTDICGGGELLTNILKRGTLTEREVAYYIKQLLEGLEHMHGRYIGHLGLTVGDLLVSRVNGYDIKVGDFGLSAHLIPGKDYFLDYGHPEFVAPEIANKQPATLLSDMWSVGVITYLLLSGLSPFLGHHDRETLTRVKEGKINFSETAFSGVTDDAKDFMSKLLVFDPSGRINVKTALQHKWIKYYADIPHSSDKPLDNIDRLREYNKKWREWYDNASCKKCYRRRTLESCFHDPSKMIYPPGECSTPEITPDRELKRPPVKPSQFDDITFQQKIQREDIDFRSESHYQNGPDTYLLQLRDPDFPLRLRQYLRVGARTSPSLAANLRDSHWGDSTLVIRERRKFVDIMDEEIDDERRGLGTRTIPMRLHHEIGTLGYAHEQMELLKQEVWKDKGSRNVEIGMAPFFREKIRDVVMKEDDEIVFRCYAVGSPKLNYTWFRNDGILLESSRIVVTELKDGRCEMRIKPSRAYDVGVYKCVARNDHGVTVCRARLKLGGKPGRPEPPIIKEIADSEVYLTWAAPKDEGKSPTLCYSLEYKQSVCSSWTAVANNIGHEYFVVRNLLPSIDYQFRTKAFNKFGWGEPGFPTTSICTKPEGAEKVKISPRRKFQQELTEQSSEYEPEEMELPDYDYNIEKNPIPITEGDTSELYRIISEMDRGRFSVVLNVWVKESGTTSTAKVIQTLPGAQSDGRQEYEIIKSLCHERIASLLSASFKADKTVLVLEKLSGVDVLTYFSLKQDYNEEMVVYVIRQVLDALEYLHFRDICYIELQPDNVVMVDQRQPDIKLVDFGAARFIPKSGGKVLVEGTLEYLAPEVIKNEVVTSGTDVWCVGVLTYILLSGVSPFKGANDQETTDNVLFVRYQFDNLHKDVTMEATKFLLQAFKACPIKRPTVTECLEQKWLAPSEYMIMKRESARFLPDKLSAFSKQFHKEKFEAMNPEMLTSLGLSSSKTNVKDEDF